MSDQQTLRDGLALALPNAFRLYPDLRRILPSVDGLALTAWGDLRRRSETGELVSVALVDGEFRVRIGGRIVSGPDDYAFPAPADLAQRLEIANGNAPAAPSSTAGAS